MCHFIQAMIDVAASEGWLAVTLRIMTLVQMVIQGQWVSDSSLLTLPHIKEAHIDQLNDALLQSRLMVSKGLKEISSLAELQLACEIEQSFLTRTLNRSLSRQDLQKVQAHTCSVTLCACVYTL